MWFGDCGDWWTIVVFRDTSKLGIDYLWSAMLILIDCRSDVAKELNLFDQHERYTFGIFPGKSDQDI